MEIIMFKLREYDENEAFVSFTYKQSCAVTISKPKFKHKCVNDSGYKCHYTKGKTSLFL